MFPYLIHYQPSSCNHCFSVAINMWLAFHSEVFTVKHLWCTYNVSMSQASIFFNWYKERTPFLGYKRWHQDKDILVHHFNFHYHWFIGPSTLSWFGHWEKCYTSPATWLESLKLLRNALLTLLSKFHTTRNSCSFLAQCLECLPYAKGCAFESHSSYWILPNVQMRHQLIWLPLALYQFFGIITWSPGVGNLWWVFH